MQCKTYCLGVCSSCSVVSAVVLLVVAIVLGTYYSGINDQVKHQIDEVRIQTRCLVSRNKKRRGSARLYARPCSMLSLVLFLCPVGDSGARPCLL